MSSEESTRATLLVPGRAPTLEGWTEGLRQRGLVAQDGRLRGEGLAFEVPFEWIENDGSFGRAFSFGTVSEAEQTAIGAAPGALLLRLPVDLRQAREAVVRLVARLGEVGALAVRLEESKLGYTLARWVELVGAWHLGRVHQGTVMVLTARRGGLASSCGMHAFSLPDSSVVVDGTAEEATTLLTAFNLYQLAEAPVLVPGQTFGPDAKTPRRVLERWPDASYPMGHACHNPFGQWRLGPPGRPGLPASGLAMVFMPTLVSTLLAAEEQHGRPLTRAQVESITEAGTCVAMEHVDAIALERERGYADLDPDRIWEKWQLARRSMGREAG